jgi:hypothetical protein
LHLGTGFGNAAGNPSPALIRQETAMTIRTGTDSAKTRKTLTAGGTA